MLVSRYNSLFHPSNGSLLGNLAVASKASDATWLSPGSSRIMPYYTGTQHAHTETDTCFWWEQCCDALAQQPDRLIMLVIIFNPGPAPAICAANHALVPPQPVVPSGLRQPGCRWNETTVLLRGTILERQVR